METKREYRVIGTEVKVRIVAGDIGRSMTDGVVNAANEASFTPMDAGVSGALRNACAPDNVCGKAKTIFDDHGETTTTMHVSPCHAGAQEAAGRLASQGVQWIIHAVAPRWSDHAADETVFDIVRPEIRTTVERALRCANAVGCASVTVPALSGGIFCHHGVDPDFKEREQRAAREELAAAITGYATAQHVASGGLREVLLVDLPASHPMSCIGLLLAAGDGCSGWEPLPAGGDATSAASGTRGEDDASLERGERVLIHSLQGKPELNGTTGLLLGYDETKGRYGVRVGTGVSLLLKAANLTRAMPASTMAPEQSPPGGRDDGGKTSAREEGEQGAMKPGAAFVAAATFGGKRSGYVFKQGTDGLGYYLDKGPLAHDTVRAGGADNADDAQMRRMLQIAAAFAALVALALAWLLREQNETRPGAAGSIFDDTQPQLGLEVPRPDAATTLQQAPAAEM